MANKDVKQLEVELHNFMLAQSRFNSNIAKAMDVVWPKLFPKAEVGDSKDKEICKT